MNKTQITFLAWLLDFTDDDSPVGQLARDIAHDLEHDRPIMFANGAPTFPPLADAWLTFQRLHVYPTWTLGALHP